MVLAPSSGPGKKLGLVIFLLLGGTAGAELEVSGVDDELEATILAYVTLAGEPCDSEDWLVRRRYRVLGQQVREALEPFGYYDAESQLWDQIARDAPYYLPVKAAGNDRTDFGPAPGEEYTVIDQQGNFLFTSTLPRNPDCAPAGYD